MISGAAMSLFLSVAAAPVSARWPQAALPIRYVVASSIDNEGSTQLNGGMPYSRAVELVDAAIAVWTSPYVTVCPGPTAWDMKSEGLFASPRGLRAISALDSANRVIFLSGSNWGASSTVLAQAVVTSYAAEPLAETFDADIQINNNYRWSEACPGETGAYDLPTVVAHEAGHLMGLGDQAAPGSVMLPELVDGYCLRALSSDDVKAVCELYPNPCPAAGMLCRPAKGPCDLAEICPTAGAACPPDEFFASKTICRAAAGPCDTAEHCTGTSTQCPVDAFQPAMVQCRPAQNAYDSAEFCTGGAPLCPPDGRALRDDCDGGMCQAGLCQVSANSSGESNPLPAQVEPQSVDEAPSWGCNAMPSPWGALGALWWLGLAQGARRRPARVPAQTLQKYDC